MKRSRFILEVSVLLNVVLLAVLACREVHFRTQGLLFESEAREWATYAGAMQAVADYGNGVRRFYRPTVAKDTSARASFTGQLDQGAEVWTWIYYENLGEASRSSTVAFTDAYNRRMLNFIKDPASYEKNGVAATRPLKGHGR